MLILMLGLCLCAGAAAPALADGLDQVVDEDQLMAQARAGRLSEADLIAQGEALSAWQRLKLYLYSLELGPYFEGLEEAIRALAHADPADQEAVARAYQGLKLSLAQCRARLEEAGREEPEQDWQRGLAGLIWLDHDWRRRVAERGAGEITNPYPLVRLLDCLDARLRGLAPEPAGQCRRWAAAAPAQREDEQ